MTWLMMGFFLVLAVALQTQVPGAAIFAQAKIPFLLSLSLYYAMCRTAPVMLVSAFAAGLLQDLLSPMPLGLSAAAFVVVCVLLSSIRSVLQTDSLITQVVFGAAASMLCAVAAWLILDAAELISYPWKWALLKVLSTGGFGAICTPIVFRLVGGLDRLVGNTRGEAGVEEEGHAFG
jgi:rod shape-determining protein MreD